MKRLRLMGLALVGVLTLVGVTTVLQPPGDDRRPPRREGPPPRLKGPPPPFEPGRVLPPRLRDELELTKDQEQQLAKLEKEVKERLLKILTDQQKKKLKELAQCAGRRPPEGGPRRPPEEGRRPPEKEDGPRRPPAKDKPPADKEVSARGGISWFATWDSGLREAQRSGRPILLGSAAPHCAGVSGIW